jgi:hypothetical protein
VVHVEMDKDGLIPDALRNAIKVTKAADKKIKFLYAIAFILLIQVLTQLHTIGFLATQDQVVM